MRMWLSLGKWHSVYFRTKDAVALLLKQHTHTHKPKETHKKTTLFSNVFAVVVWVACFFFCLLYNCMCSVFLFLCLLLVSFVYCTIACVLCFFPDTTPRQNFQTHLRDRTPRRNSRTKFPDKTQKLKSQTNSQTKFPDKTSRNHSQAEFPDKAHR